MFFLSFIIFKEYVTAQGALVLKMLTTQFCYDMSLIRSLDFTAALLQILANDPDQSVKQAVEESYNTTLKPWHRWISSAAYRVLLQLLLLSLII